MRELAGPLVSADWLAEHLDDVRIVDVRWSIDTGPGRSAYLAGHIPGAVFADLDVDLSDPPSWRGRHPLPSAERFAETRRQLGFDRPVVAYDDRSGSIAARLWWMLDSIGHPAAVLDGGIDAWEGELETGSVEAGLNELLEPIPWPADSYIDADDVLDAIAAGAVLLDARSAERFEGSPNPIDSNPGHIPGARSNPWTENLDSSGRLAPSHVQQQRLRELGVGPGVDVIASCGSGVTGCHNLLATRLAGVERGRLYVGSWSQWSLDPKRPIARR